VAQHGVDLTTVREHCDTPTTNSRWDLPAGLGHGKKMAQNSASRWYEGAYIYQSAGSQIRISRIDKEFTEKRTRVDMERG
jgi:hypothetical protein